MIFFTTIAAAQAMGAIPKTLVHKPFNLFTTNGVTSQMNDEPTTDGQTTDTPVSESPYEFLNDLAQLDHTTGVMSQTDLAKQLGNLSEGVPRGAVKALAKTIPLDRLKADGRLTAQGVELVTRYIQRGDTTAEAWIHGLMQAMKSPEHRALTGVVPTESAADIDLGFLGDRKAQIEANSNALALRGDSELASLMAKSQELSQHFGSINAAEIQAAEDAAYQAELDKLTAAMRGKIKAQQAFLASLENQGPTLNFQ
jgi:NADH dehydrogenase/NADH:ubiquinone oxidoreductase subunit G